MPMPSTHMGRRWKCPGARTVLVVLWLLTLAAAHLGNHGDVSYVQSATWGRPRPTRIPMQVRERRSEKRAPSRGGRPRGKDSEARKLTARMKGAKSAEGFVKILNSAVEGPIFNYFQRLMCLSPIGHLERSGKLAEAAGSLKFSKLNARVQKMIEEGQLHARELANVIWSSAHLFDEYRMCSIWCLRLWRRSQTRPKI